MLHCLGANDICKENKKKKKKPEDRIYLDKMLESKNRSKNDFTPFITYCPLDKDTSPCTLCHAVAPGRWYLNWNTSTQPCSGSSMTVHVPLLMASTFKLLIDAVLVTDVHGSSVP